MVPHGDHLKAKGQHVLVKAKVHHALKIEARFFAVGHGLGQGGLNAPQHLKVGGNAAIVKAEAHDRTRYGGEKKDVSRSGPPPGGKGRTLPSEALPWHTRDLHTAHLGRQRAWQSPLTSSLWGVGFPACSVVTT